MTSELFSVFARTSSVDHTVQLTNETSGAMCLASTMWSGYVSSVRIPKGCAFKVWESKVQAINPSSVHIQVAMSGTGTVYQTIETDTVDVSGGEQRTTRSGRPLVVESPDGERSVRFLYRGTGATMTSNVILASYNVEIVELNVD
jgi:hypothetical protein